VIQEEGNVHQGAAADQEEIRPGDLVYLTQEALRKAPRLMGPMKLYSIGWPEFQVVKVFEEDGIKHYAISGCCQNLLLNRKTGAWLCWGHDAKWFRKLRVEEPATEAPPPPPEKEQTPPRERRPGDRILSAEVPVLGEIGAIEFLEDETNPQFIVRFAKQRGVLSGRAAVELFKLAQAKGIL
jgi:hypothetical protein